MSTNSPDTATSHETPKVGFNWLIPLFAVSVAFVVLFLIIPLGRILQETAGILASSERPLPQGFFPYMFRITLNSLRLATLTTLFSLGIAIPLAVAISKLQVKFGTGWTVLLTVPLITPPFISSFATIILLGRTGILMRLWVMMGFETFSIYGLKGLVITQVLHLMPYSLLIILAGLKTVPASIEEAAHSLGESFFGTMRKIVLPYTVPHILMGGTLVFLTSLGDVGAPLLIGGNYRVLPVEIYANFVSYLGDDRIPVIFSAWIILMASIMMVAVKYLLKKAELKHSFKVRTISYDLPVLRKVATGVIAFVSVVFLLPYVSIVVSSLGTIWTTGWLPNDFTLLHYQRAVLQGGPIRNTLLLLAGAMPLAVLVSIGLGQMHRSVPRMRWFDYFTLLPFIIPGVVMGIGITRTYGTLQIGGFDFTATAWALIMALAIRRLPHAVRVLTAGFARIDKSLEEASWSLGASPSRTFKDIVLPQLRPTIFAASVILAVKLVTELGATLILYPPGWDTMAVYIYYYVSEGQIARGSAMGVVLIIMVAAGTAYSNRFSKNKRLT